MLIQFIYFSVSYILENVAIKSLQFPSSNCVSSSKESKGFVPRKRGHNCSKNMTITANLIATPANVVSILRADSSPGEIQFNRGELIRLHYSRFISQDRTQSVNFPGRKAALYRPVTTDIHRNS